MENYKEIFNQISYTYYPKDMYEFDLSFHKSQESKNFINKINSVSINEFDELTSKICKIHSNTSRFEMGNNFPSYIIQIDLSEKQNSKSVITIYLSYLVPFYSLFILKGNYSNKSVTVDLDGEEKEEFLMNELKSIITRELKYHEFERKIIDDKIPLIKISDNFSYFNAFFADAHRINNF